MKKSTRNQGNVHTFLLFETDLSVWFQGNEIMNNEPPSLMLFLRSMKWETLNQLGVASTHHKSDTTYQVFGGKLDMLSNNCAAKVLFQFVQGTDYTLCIYLVNSESTFKACKATSVWLLVPLETTVYGLL